MLKVNNIADTDIQKLFEANKQRLFNQEPYMWHQIRNIPTSKGVYVICHLTPDRIVYVGESKNMYDRIYNHHRTGNNSSFRRNLEAIKFKNQFQDRRVIISQFLDECIVYCLPLVMGRKELEEYLIKDLKPLYNKAETK